MNAPPSATSHSGTNTQKGVLLLLWLGATAIGTFLALLVFEAAYFQGDYIPTGNDSFYHARRMLDAAVGERGFYQFDERLHVPDGAWIPWPWATSPTSTS